MTKHEVRLKADDYEFAESRTPSRRMATLQTLDYSVLQQCMHCGMCLPTCPTYDATKRERNSPRGRIALMRAIADGELEVTRTFADEMSYCLGCLACQTACPAGVNYAELFETARSDIERSGINDAPARNFWRAHDARLPLHEVHARCGRPAPCRASISASAWRPPSATFGLTMFLPATLRRLEPQTPRMAPAFSNRLIAPQSRRAEHRATVWRC